MLIPRDDAVLISGDNFPWAAAYNYDQVSGPFHFELDGNDLICRCCCCFNELSEDLVIADDVRGTHSGKIAKVTTKGRLPFGTGVGFRHSHQYSEHAMRAVTDVRIPPGTELKSALAIDELVLPGDYDAWRTLDDSDQLSDWRTLDHDLEWADHPRLLVFRRSDGVELEIGIGTDLWRWQNGFTEKANMGHYQLFRRDEKWIFQRHVTVPTETFAPAPRDYRFSWYLAWTPTDWRKPESSDAVAVPWRPDAGIDLNAVRQLLKQPETILALDLGKLSAAPEWQHQPGIGLCFASRATIKRLKRAIRQLASLDLRGRTIEIHGLIPGYCEQGHHVAGQTPRPHWDLANILEFGFWAQAQLPASTCLQNTYGEWDIPSLRHLFLRSDHDEEPFVYNYVPIENET